MKFGLIGEKLSHSYSKIIHEALGKYPYDLFSLDHNEFTRFLSERNFDGLNVTIPYKQAVMPFCDKITDLATEIGAVNTLYFRQGKLWGTNTDYYGFLYAARQAEVSFEGNHVYILGNGGTSLTARKAAADRGAASITIVSRKASPGCISYEELQECCNVDIMVNTTPAGMYPQNETRLIDLDDFPDCKGVIDVIYNPLYTDLLLQAQQRGIPNSNGLPMLVAQATCAAELFLDTSGLQVENERIMAGLQGETENIVLIGMPGCGKSTIGKRLADRLGKDFVDMDAAIEARTGKTIPAIFEEKGEGYFRSLESETAASLGKERNQVIATGGGVVLTPKNMRSLRQNGFIVFIQRDLNSLAMDDRPLSKDKKALKAMYETRLPLYNEYSHAVFHSVEGIDQNLNPLLSLIENR